MCGIAGYINFDRDKLAHLSTIKAMATCLSHRGPDGEGFFVNKNVALGHRRLSIIDLHTGDQPMFSNDRSKVLIFNGEIYNYIELKNELRSMGHHFTTNSDTEIIIKAYEQWGYDCQNKFNGMWAFALWDEREQQLFLSRDRIGEKPLFYCHYNGSFVFASEIKSLFNFGVPREVRPELTEIYLTLTNIPAPHTFYKNVYKVMPGHFMVIRDGQLDARKYWDLPEIDESSMITNKQDVYENFEFLLKDSIGIRMRADVPYGAFLSGGLDSSSVVSVMSGIMPEPVKTFTIGFENKAFDESKLAQEVAEKYNTTHFALQVRPENISELLQKASFYYDEPFGDSSAIPTYYVSKFARQHVKMVLTGDGGDEVLSGYPSYAGIKLSGIINSFPESITRSAAKLTSSIGSSFKGGLRYKLNRIGSIISTAGMDFTNQLAEKRSFTDLSSIKVLTHHINGVVPIEDYLTEFIKSCSYRDGFYKLMYFNFKHDLPNDYLVKVDRMSMAHSLETRIPFLDFRLIEYMVRVHKNVKLDGWERKSVLRKTIGKTLPTSVLNAPKKGFVVPLREWFQKESFEDTVLSNLREVGHLTDKQTVSEIFEQNRSRVKDNGNFIWTLLMLDKYLRSDR
ncbi:MAG TPA: asparagine synthase (glutamine-hydrolyzing) [Flavitalea sp.]|nr:asparagine synthase (glutamine-hydrolyzing) [Flavitalea sp.]